MCGIIGAWLPQNEITKSDFIEIIDSIHHRGPDERGLMIENNFYLGMRRLSIIDLKHGQQPVFSEDKSKAVIFNGEIYNYKFLSKKLKAQGHEFSTECDTEVIVHTLENSFDDIKNLRGMFAFCYFDREKQEINLFRDRIGVKPLYYLYVPGKIFAFASEIKGIEKICKEVNYNLEINEESIYHYFSFANIPQPLTIYKNVYALMPGHYLIFDKKSIKINKYWEYKYEPKPTLSFEEAKEDIHTELKESVRLRLHSDVPMGLFLSGGLDSSIIAYLSAKELNKNLKTYTVGFPGHKEFDESSIANRTAKSLGLDNILLPMEYSPLESLKKLTSIYDQPFADPSAIPSVEISKLASKEVKVVLNGDGGDEQFGGYRRYVLGKKLDIIPNLSFAYPAFKILNPARRTSLGFLQRLVKTSGLSIAEQNIALSTDMLLDNDKRNIFSFANKYATESFILNFKNDNIKNSLDHSMHFDRNINLLSGLLVKMDMASSSASIEARSPFLDNILFEKSSLLNVDYKINGTQTKYILKELYKDKLPHEVIYGKKKGFEIPLNKWLKTDFKPLINEMLLDENCRFYTYVSIEFVNELFLENKYNHFNIDYLRYSTLVLYLWFKEKHN
jgi:asparagine synthase (glutamine-hydrolysing)